jgi:hypothetical protein
VKDSAIGVAVLTGAAIAFAPVAHADKDSDYINNLKNHGLSPVGISESQWETDVISNAHQICDMAANGLSRDGIKAHFEPTYPDKKDIVDRMTDAAVATYCPQYW